MVNIFWFRQDLRISDNPGLFAAAQNSKILPIYILDDNEAGISKMGEASKWWLHHSLNSLNQSLDNKLNTYIGNAKEIILKLIKEHNVTGIYWNKCYEPWRIEQDKNIEIMLKSMNIACKSFNASLLWQPEEIATQDNKAYKVYTPFYRKCLQTKLHRDIIPIPNQLELIKDTSIEKLKLLPDIEWYKEMEESWKIGEEAAQAKLTNFINKGLAGYEEGRNFPAQRHTSQLSPHLHFGEISPNQIWQKAVQSKDNECFLKEIVWREFSYYLLYHFPELPRKNFQTKFDNFPWLDDKKLLKAWQQGKTGYPIVDAGMRELWQTGYMHNRVRMIVGSFLVKNLLLHWHHGEEWFWDCLVDADLASNSASWQWVAGSGADAAPYFRIFNPILQGEKFDKDGEYTRKFVPELAKLPNRYLFKPWEAPQAILKDANFVLGEN